jgi:hypothetical protein
MSGATDLHRRLAGGEIARLTEAAWASVAGDFTVVVSHDTGVAGPLLLVTHAGRWAAVERPRAGERVVRPLAGKKDAHDFLRERLAAYERMWDG